MKKVLIIGRGVLGQTLEKIIVSQRKYQATMVSAHQLSEFPGADAYALTERVEVVEELMSKFTKDHKVIDCSPAFRLDPEWVYGFHYGKPQDRNSVKIRLSRANRVANPGCMATAGLLLLNPLNHGSFWYENLYLDTTIGYSSGGSQMIDHYRETKMAQPGCKFVHLDKEHSHVQEILTHGKVETTVVLNPKIVNDEVGIMMQVWIPWYNVDLMYDAYRNYYEGTDIVVERGTERSITTRSHHSLTGAKIRMYQQRKGTIINCTMNNLGIGGAQTAYTSIDCMLS